MVRVVLCATINQLQFCYLPPTEKADETIKFTSLCSVDVTNQFNIETWKFRFVWVTSILYLVTGVKSDIKHTLQVTSSLHYEIQGNL